MNTLDIHISIDELQMDELPADDQQLIGRALLATDHAYAKYSHFHVGAAVRLADGTIVIGANQENAAFPSGLCAERTAIFAAQASHPDQPITKLTIAARGEQGTTAEPVTPCGACRQVMLEIEDRYQQPIEILLYGTNRILRIRSAKDLMPLCFVDASMK